MDLLFDSDEAANVIRARRIWDEAGDIDDGEAEAYLRALGGRPPWPDALRYCENCYHGPTGGSYPALIAAVTDAAGRVMGITRHFLGDDVKPRNLMLGAIAGSAVRFGRHRGGALLIAESLRLAIKLFYATGEPTWAALSAAGISRLILPPDAEVAVAPSSAAGRAAAEKRGFRVVDSADLMAAAPIGATMVRSRAALRIKPSRSTGG